MAEAVEQKKNRTLLVEAKVKVELVDYQGEVNDTVLNDLSEELEGRLEDGLTAVVYSIRERYKYRTPEQGWLAFKVEV